MFKFITGAVAASFLVLSGCTLPTGSFDDSLKYACGNGPTAHLAFSIYASKNDVSPQVIQNENDAYRTLMAVCANPSPDKVRVALESYADILNSRS